MNKKSNFPYSLITLVLVMALSACGAPESASPTLDMDTIFTQVAETLAAEFTQTALAVPTATNTPEPTFTPLPSPTLAQAFAITTSSATVVPTLSGATAYPTISTTAYDCFDAALVADLSIPAGTKFEPGDRFEKSWRVLNTGTCAWTNDFVLTHVGGDIFGSDAIKVRQRVPVGNTRDISLQMVAPATTGKVTSSWQLATNNGNLFGPLLTVSITLPGPNVSPTSDCYNATLVSDVTIPDGTELNPGESFTKMWDIRNSGTCTWNADFKIAVVGGEFFGSDTTKIRRNVEAADVIRISLKMVAPASSGSVTSSWQMATDAGDLFGQVFTIEIVVK